MMKFLDFQGQLISNAPVPNLKLDLEEDRNSRYCQRFSAEVEGRRIGKDYAQEQLKKMKVTDGSAFATSNSNGLN